MKAATSGRRRQLTNEQLYLLVSLPIISNTIVALIGILINNGRLSDLRGHMDDRIDDLKETINAKFATAHAELIRVEQVMDARLKHLED
jgi:hypothetical protein